MSQGSQSRRLLGRERPRATPRLLGFDYSKPGSYFITSCTQNRACLFGEVTDGRLHLTEAGEMVERWWSELTNKFPQITTDTHVVMPNHIHGIVTIRGRVGADLCVRPSSTQAQAHQPPQAHQPLESTSLTTVMQWFKTMTTNGYIQGVHQAGWLPFEGKVWQRSFHNHIIQDHKEWDCIRQYIVRNPDRWAEDEENPHSISEGWADT